MAKYTVTFTRTVYHSADIEIDAESEDDADSKAMSLCDALRNDTWKGQIDWELDDDIYDVEDIYCRKR